MTIRGEKRRAYDKSWDNWDAETLVSTLADGFVFDDPAMPEPIKKGDMAAYMASWQDRVKLLGGTGEINCSDRVEVDEDGAVVSWNWWSFVGTKYEGSAVTRTTDEGVQYERITYYPDTPDFSNAN